VNHSVDYKGLTIHYSNGEYYIATNPTKKFYTFNDAKREVDKVQESLNDNFINIKEILKRKH